MLSYLYDSPRHFSYIDHLFYFMQREHHITCARSTFYRYIVNDEDLRLSFQKHNKTEFIQRFKTQPGQQAQFDLKESDSRFLKSIYFTLNSTKEKTTPISSHAYL